MNDQRDKRFVQQSIDEGLSSMQGDPWLARRIIASEKGEEPVVKKFSAAMVIAVVLVCIIAAGALAATLNAWGIIDFAGHHMNAYIPPKYEECISHEDLTFETDSVSCTIQESYYDGKILRLTALFVSKRDELLISMLSSAEYPISDLFRQFDQNDDATELETIGSFAIRQHNGQLALVDLSVDTDLLDSSCDYAGNEDGTLTYYLECQFEEEHQEISIPLKISYVPMTLTAELAKPWQRHPELTESNTITMSFRPVETKQFISEDPLDFPGAGVRIVRVVMNVTPLEIRYILDYEITDPDAFHAQENGLWFEFIDSRRTEADYNNQRVSNGLSSGGIADRLDGSNSLPDGTGTVYRQTGAIGLDALSDQYTIRAYNAWEKTRYEAVTFTVKAAG